MSIGVQSLLKKNLLLTFNCGDEMYGFPDTGREVQLKGLYCAPRQYSGSPFYPELKRISGDDGLNSEYFEVAHFLESLLLQDPDAVAMLWVERKHIYFAHPLYLIIREAREALTGLRFSRALKRRSDAKIETLLRRSTFQHNNPPQPVHYLTSTSSEQARPISDFFSGYKAIPLGESLYGLVRQPGASLLGNFTHSGDVSQIPTSGPIDAIYRFDEPLFRSDVEHWRTVWRTRKTQGDRGYDTNLAAQAALELRIAFEYATEGQVYIERKDVDELIAIKEGHLSIHELLEYAQDLSTLLEEKILTSPLPDAPERDFCAELLLEIQEKMWANRG